MSLVTGAEIFILTKTRIGDRMQATTAQVSSQSEIIVGLLIMANMANDRPDGFLHSGPARDRAQSGSESQPCV